MGERACFTVSDRRTPAALFQSEVNGWCQAVHDLNFNTYFPRVAERDTPTKWPKMIWAITSFFNPQCYSNRLRNYREFRDKLRVPLVTFELAFNENFSLGPGDADILIQRRSQDVMWQKERMLNLALSAVPVDCDKIVWLDCDVVFADDDWADRTSDALEQYPLLQPFDRLHHLGRNETVESHGAAVTGPIVSLAAGLQNGKVPISAFQQREASQSWRYAPGLAWAGRRELLETHGLYDRFILGSGDKAVVGAAFGQQAALKPVYSLNDQQHRHYMEWAEAFSVDVQGEVGFVAGKLYHFWHGDVRRRNYWGRYLGLRPFQFDPCRDIEIDGNGVWKWNSEKPEMHQFVSEYFASRREDG